MESPRRSRLANEISIFDEAEEDEQAARDVDDAGPNLDKLNATDSIDGLHDRAPSPPEDPQEYSHQESTDDEPSFNDEDPFTESDASDRDEGFTEEGDSFESNEYGGVDPVKSLSYQIAHKYDRSFSSTTAIHLDDPDHPGHHESIDYKIPFAGGDRSTTLLYDATTLGGESRKQSDTFSAPPEDLDLPRTPSKHGRQGIYSPTPRHGSTPREKLLSQQIHDYELNTPTRDRLLSSTRARDGSSQRRPVFRNPSSVRAMQMSSPPPFPNSPRSARQRRMGSAMSMSQDGGSVHRRSFQESSPKPAHPNKEYPLMLLHCSVTISSLPYTQATLQAVLPPATLENLSLLKEKIGMTVLERGLLIPHPGDEYELLEERVLETLELKIPRIGKCGHFFIENMATDEIADEVLANKEIANNDSPAAPKEKPEAKTGFDGAGKCEDCRRHVAPELLGQQIGTLRKWDIKVYAANGLMRAGAWGTAWREMEKIDLEVGVYIPDDLRRQLEDKAVEEAEAKGALHQRGQSHELSDDLRRTFEAPVPPLMTRQRSSGLDIASTAAVTRPPSSHSGKGNRSREVSHQRPKSQVPLSTLLANYVRRNLQQKPEVFIGIVILFIGIIFSGRSFFAPHAPAGIITHGTAAPAQHNQATLENSIATSAATSQDPVPNTVTESVEVTTTGWLIPACTFGAGELDAQEMTALPRNIASSILDSLATVSAPSALPTSTLAGAKSLADAEPALPSSSETNSEVSPEPSQEASSAAILHDANEPESAAEQSLVEKLLEFVSDGDDQAGLEE